LKKKILEMKTWSGADRHRLASAGGIEPPNGGIKISLIIQRFQGAPGKMAEMPPSSFNSLAAVSK
jgi:hypothetical protein